MRLARRSRAACLDFGHGQLSVLEVVDRAVTGWDLRSLPDGLLRNGDPSEPEALGGLVRESLRLAGIEARRARMTLPDEVAVSRHFTLPKMPRRDLARAVRYSAERHLPFPIDRARWVWDVVDATDASVRVYLVAAWSDIIDRYALVARSAGLEPEILEPRSTAIARALRQDRALLVDGSSTRVYLTLLVDGQPIFVDEHSAGQGAAQQREVIDRMLQHAFRYQSTLSDGSTRMPPVLLAGELEDADLQLPVMGRPVSRVLNGALPAAPAGFRAGRFLANLGLAMRSR